MPRRYSMAHRRKIAALMRRLNADPAYRAARSNRMRQLRADPKFVAAYLAAMKRLRLPDKTRAAVIAALTADPNAARVARKLGVGYNNVRKFARAAGISLSPGRPRHRPRPTRLKH